MIVTGITTEQFNEIVAKLNATTYGGNLNTEIGRIYSPTRFAGRVTVRESGARLFPKDKSRTAPGARRSWSGRRIAAACWHAYRDVLAGVFEVNPDARVRTAMAKYIGREGFLANYPETANQNIGSMASPAYMPELCDCEDYGIDTREAG